MSPVPSLGVLSFTKFTSPEDTLDALGRVVPDQTTAAEVEAELNRAGQPGPLWNDLLAYIPPLASANVAAGSQVAVDNELLRAARAKRDDGPLLLWVALILADPRLEALVREELADADGHLKASAIDKSAMVSILARRTAADPNHPDGDKPATNILNLLDRCKLIVPVKHGTSTVGLDHTLPTRHAVPGAVRLIAERLADRGFEVLPDRELELALSIGANAWLNLSTDEFRAAYLDGGQTLQAQSIRQPVPDEIAELAAQLRRKGQVVLQGPPGAGKTYVAKRYVRWVTADRPEDSRLQAVIDSLPVNERTVVGIADEVQRRGLVGLWDIVQFHPGYDYSDFVRALVAQPHGAGVTFVPQHKIFSLVCAVGAELERRKFAIELVLILDEINRGDIPNIFGELLYALEYRGEAVATPHSVDGDASLTVPDSLSILGTMNTADRSIAVIDYALRRRFVFLDVSASDAPIRAYPFDDERTRSAALYLHAATANALKDAPSGLQVGPSYFLAAADVDADSLAVLAARYVYEVLPLLTEYEMEGEVDPAAISALRNTFGVVGGAQRTHTDALLAHLATSPWIDAAEITEQPQEEP